MKNVIHSAASGTFARAVASTVAWFAPVASLASLASLAVGSLALPAPAAAQQVVREAGKTCPKPFNLVDGKCDLKDEEVEKLTPEQCMGPGLALVGSPAKCQIDRRQLPAPTCSGGSLPLAFDRELGQCIVKPGAVPKSSLTDFLGDCYRMRGLPPGYSGSLAADKLYQVRAQRPEGESDKWLTLAEADESGRIGCKPVPNATLLEVKASDLIAYGADRAGWAFGVLALPYKFHTDDRSFGSSTAIGPYVGRRWGTPGSAYTFAVAATIGSVKGEVRDAQGNITDTPDLQAFSLAVGYAYDIAKAPETRAFKVGLFVGADWVSSSDVVKYKHNRKPWVAFQVGFDFFD